MATEDNAGVGMIAGYGVFPLELIAELNKQHIDVHVVAIREECAAEVENLAASTTWLQVGQLKAMIQAFHSKAITQVIMAGKVQKLHLFRNFKPDFLAVKTLLSLPDKRDDTIMIAITALLEKEGIEVISQLAHAGEMLATVGHIAGPKLSKAQLQDAHFGFPQAKAIAGFDIGQTIVVKEGAMLAVEAIEGTDAAIERGGDLGHGRSMVVKVAKPKQDLRFDVPAIGPDTLQVMHQHGCTVLIVEANLTLILDRVRTFALAKSYGITLYGYTDAIK
ncbi:MAG: UDP-2,3-diacylglucosamine diphosphatase LpxI [Zetaproteobacteria bacterium]|nr:UDP-2,3-diacylglucosamine diphosphatase LpxI [Zetaproteobacteria bacterium]